MPAEQRWTRRCKNERLGSTCVLCCDDMHSVDYCNCNQKGVVTMRGLITLAVIIGTLAFVAGVCYEIGSFWTWQALRWLWGV